MFLVAKLIRMLLSVNFYVLHLSKSHKQTSDAWNANWKLADNEELFNKLIV